MSAINGRLYNTRNVLKRFGQPFFFFFHKIRAEETRRPRDTTTTNENGFRRGAARGTEPRKQNRYRNNIIIG